MAASDRWLFVEQTGEIFLVKRQGDEIRGRLVSREALSREFPALYHELLASDRKGRAESHRRAFEMSEFDKLAGILTDSDAAAIREAAEAYKRDSGSPEGPHPKHELVLFMAVARSRGKYIVALERELAAYQRSARGNPTAEGQDEFLAARQEELRPLWRADLEEVIREAGGKLW